MKKLSQKILSTLIALVLFSSSLSLTSMAAGVQNSGTGGTPHPIFSVPLFSPNPVRANGWVAAFDVFRPWAATKEGARILETNPKWRMVLNLINSMSTESRLSVVSPLIQAADQTPAGKRLRNAMTKIGDLPTIAEQEKLFERMVKDLESTGKKASSKIESAARKLSKAYLERPSVSLEDVQGLKGRIYELGPIVELFSSLVELGIYGDIPEVRENAQKARQELLDLNEKLVLLRMGDETAQQMSEMQFERAPKVWISPWAEEESGPAKSPSVSAPEVVGEEGGAAPATPETQEKSRLVQPPSAPAVYVPTQAELIKFGNVDLPRVAFPTQTDIPKLLAEGNRMSEATIVALYEENLEEDVASILEGVKRGDRYIVVADYSNVFPDRMGRGEDMKPRSPQIQALIDNVGPNLELYVLKGLGSIGINHNKFRIWNLRKDVAGTIRKILQTGSFNYTITSQKNHWENVMFVEDPVTIVLYETYFKWMLSLARPYREDLKPENPKIVPGTTPRDENPSVLFHGTKFPRASFSPKGDTLDWLLKMLELTTDEFFMSIFGFYPPPPLQQGFLELLKRGKRLRVLADYGQSHNRASTAALLGIMDNGGEVKLISGPNETPWKGGPHERSEKNHNKEAMADFKSESEGLFGESGSTNVSKNAYDNNFENTLWLRDVYLALLREQAEYMWSVAFKPDRRRMQELVTSPTAPR
ncbi:MAG: hypothetical protein HY399_01420 [Elusimicrobia bacterium]|nr:hypothetical protein [Elusimicrobiota bacterium]